MQRSANYTTTHLIRSTFSMHVIKVVHYQLVETQGSGQLYYCVEPSAQEPRCTIIWSYVLLRICMHLQDPAAHGSTTEKQENQS